MGAAWRRRGRADGRTTEFPDSSIGNDAGLRPNFAFPRVPHVVQPEAEPAQPGAAEGQNVPAPAFLGRFIPNRRD
jgi:hypothetical protein